MLADNGIELQKHRESLDSIAEYLIYSVAPNIINPQANSANGNYSHYEGLPLWQLNARKLHLASVISDEALLFRFFRKNKFSIANTQIALTNHLQWRMQNNTSSICINSLSPEAKEYAAIGLLHYFGQDKYGRPCAVFNLGKYDASAGKKDIEELREFLIFTLEVGRRCVAAANESFQYSSSRTNGEGDIYDAARSDYQSFPAVSALQGKGSHRSLYALNSLERRFPVKFTPPNVKEGLTPFVAQMCVILDLNGVGMGNLNYEVIPLLYDLFHRHFPQVFGTIYVLNYGWIHAGIWSILKAALPADACRKLMFLTKEELKEHFFDEYLLEEHGGRAVHSFSLEACPYFNTYQSDPSPSQPFNFPSSSLLSVLARLNTLDEANPTDDPDIWYDAPEFPIAPVKSAADLQSLLRSSSYRNLRSGKSSVGLSATFSSQSLFSASHTNPRRGKSNMTLKDINLSLPPFPLPSPRMTSIYKNGHMLSPGNRQLHSAGSYFPPTVSSSHLNSNLKKSDGGRAQSKQSRSVARRKRRSGFNGLKLVVGFPWIISMAIARFLVKNVLRIVKRMCENKADAALQQNTRLIQKSKSQKMGGLVMKLGSDPSLEEDDADEDDDEVEELLPLQTKTGVKSSRPRLFGLPMGMEKTCTSLVATTLLVCACLGVWNVTRHLSIKESIRRYWLTIFGRLNSVVVSI